MVQLIPGDIRYWKHFSEWTYPEYTFKGMSTSVHGCKHGMRDWGEPEQMPKSGSFGVRLVKSTPSIANVFFFEVPTSNR